MPKTAPTQEKRYLEAFEAFRGAGAARDPMWARHLRRKAIDSFRDLGFPIARRGNEEWKYTDVGPIARAPFQTPVTPARVEAGDLEPFTLGRPDWSRLVFVYGSYAEGLSSVSTQPHGVRVLDIAEAMATSPDLVEQHMARYADYGPNAFIALNTAFLHHGAFLHIPRGTLMEEPVHLLFLSTSQEEAVSYPRVMVLCGDESRATIIESYCGLSGGRYFTNAVTEMVVGAGARVDYYRLQRQSEDAFHVTNTQVTLGRDSNLLSVNIDLGGGVTRNNLNVLMGDEGGSCVLNGLYLVNGSQHVDNQVIVDHAMPYTTSRELYKGVLDGRSRSVFHGSIIVREGARKVDAHQLDKNLLLSDQAEADTKPTFWIYCDDVKCGHGAACGQIDETALFYLRSRGIGERAARGMLTRAFVSEVVESIGNEQVRSQVDALVQDRLQEWLGE